MSTKYKSSFINFFIIFVILAVLYYLNTKREKYMESYTENYVENYIENSPSNIKRFDNMNMKNGKLSDKKDSKKLHLYTLDSNDEILNTIGYFSNDIDDIDYSRNIYTNNDNVKGNITYNITKDNKIPFDKDPTFVFKLSFVPRGYAITSDKKRLTIDNNINYYFSSYPMKK